MGKEMNQDSVESSTWWIDNLKQELREHIITLFDKNPLNVGENIDAVVNVLLRKNYPRIINIIGKDSAPYYFWVFTKYLKWVLKREVQKEIEFYKKTCADILLREQIEAWREFYEKGMSQD